MANMQWQHNVKQDVERGREGGILYKQLQVKVHNVVVHIISPGTLNNIDASLS